MRKELFLLIIPFVLVFACGENKESSQEKSISNEWELVILDSIQVDYLGSVNGGEFRNGKGVIFDFKTNSLIEFDETGKILNQQSNPKEGPGAVIYPTTLRYDEFGKLYGMSFLTQLENRIRQYCVIQLVTLIVFTIGSQLLTSSHRVCP
jgi:hypothetical protein